MDRLSSWLNVADWLDLAYVAPHEILFRLILAIGLSCLVGLDRELKNKPLGLRTNMLVALGSASFCLVVMELIYGLEDASHLARIDASRVIEGIIGGIGFLGAGAIIHGRDRVIGATTGATIWVVGAIGMTCGFGLYLHAIAITVLALFLLTVLGFAQRPAQQPDERRGSAARASSAPGSEPAVPGRR